MLFFFIKMIRLIVYELKRKPSLAAVTFVISLRWGGGVSERILIVLR